MTLCAAGRRRRQVLPGGAHGALVAATSGEDPGELPVVLSEPGGRLSTWPGPRGRSLHHAAGTAARVLPGTPLSPTLPRPGRRAHRRTGSRSPPSVPRCFCFPPGQRRSAATQAQRGLSRKVYGAQVSEGGEDGASTSEGWREGRRRRPGRVHDGRGAYARGRGLYAGRHRADLDLHCCF